MRSCLKKRQKKNEEEKEKEEEEKQKIERAREKGGEKERLTEPSYSIFLYDKFTMDTEGRENIFATNSYKDIL